ncbi:3-oxo-Delta(4,5)-steroid 5-beta-reductase-like [Magnolia sinica]|uniref:3-oxo-Delta(4,5)-steroid 5-beta-reductase-like n=1 Tax=Magnolia sinica TaxID=86752 RepID=UPI002657FD43|nr:3-oxo-Delta(4,5)-steroid 5-beta-reductase-like [Magnolia sinica]
MELETPETPVALVVGVTGMAGLSLAEALKKPTALGGPWKVYGAARRPKPTWFSPSLLDLYIQFNALDPHDTCKNLSIISEHVTHLFWVVLQAHDNEEANIATNSSMLSNVLHVLTSNSTTSRLRHVTLQTGTKHYIGPDLDHAGPSDPPFHENMTRLPYPNFYYVLEDLLASYSPAFTWSVHRSSIIIGASSRSIYNMLLTLATYALICRREGAPFRYPGSRYTWEHFCDASDAGLLAQQQIWAAVSDSAKNQAFNCTNGDVFTWKAFWTVLSEIFGVEPVPPCGDIAEFNWVEEMKEKGGVWDAIVRENGLHETKLEEITCFGASNAVMNFGFQHVSSMNKSREFGFLGYVDTLKSLRKWIERLREMNILPKT